MFSKYKRASWFFSSDIEDLSSSSFNELTKEWIFRIDQQLKVELKSTIFAKNLEQKTQIHREIEVFQNFIFMNYFEALKKFFETTVNSIRQKIRQKMKDYQHWLKHFKEDFISSVISTSSILFDLVSAYASDSSTNRIKILSWKERIVIAIAIVRMKLSIREVAFKHEVNRQTIVNHMNDSNFRSDVRKLFENWKKQTILIFVDRTSELEFSSIMNMMKEKTILLLRARDVDKKSRVCWTSRFLNRHSKYKIKFSRHLNQARHWNLNSQIFSDWFDLFNRTCRKYDIVNEDMYNMNEKKFMMRMREKMKWMKWNLMFIFFFDVYILAKISRVLIFASVKSIQDKLAFSRNKWKKIHLFVYATSRFFYFIVADFLHSKMIIRKSNKNVFAIQFDDQRWVITIEFVFSQDTIFKSMIIFVEKKTQKAWTKQWIHFVYVVFDNE